MSISRIAELSMLSEFEKISNKMGTRFAPTEGEKKELKSIARQNQLGRTLGTAGSVGMLTSIPLSFMSKKGPAGILAKVSPALAVGGATSALTGMAVRGHSQKRARNFGRKLAKRYVAHRKAQQGMQG